jgi:hypothetical protein
VQLFVVIVAFLAIETLQSEGAVRLHAAESAELGGLCAGFLGPGCLTHR